MRFDIWSKAVTAQAVDCLVTGVFEDNELGAEAQAIDAKARGRLAAIVMRGDFSGRLGDTLLLTELPGLPAPRVLLVGLGPQKKYGRKAWRKATAAALQMLARTRVRSIAIAIDRPDAKELDDYAFARAIAQLTGAALYRINDQKTGKKPKPAVLESVTAGPVRAALAESARRGFAHGEALAAAQRLQRDLGNLPSNICTPSYLAEQAQALAKAHASVSVQVFDEAGIRKLKMGAFLAVAQGAEEPPRFIVLEYRGAKANQAPIVLVGKGITFDTGGISLKDPGAMDEMKYDMSGSAAVLAAITFVAEARLPIRLVGLIAACENMPSGRAIKPGDVVTTASGQTVEILNTDAEGRLVLCDALHYARRYEPAAVVDIATLTGACVVALGAHHTGVMSNDDELAQELVAAGVRSDDRAWQLPLTEEYGEQLKSNFADMANIGGREGGAITAAAFLSKFTEGLKWAHLDVAGVAYKGGASNPHKGSTGRPVALLADFLVQRAGR